MKVSICIPSYKQPDFLRRCIDSILRQSYSDYEIVVTDDSPNDAIEELLKNYQDTRIRYYHNHCPLGSPANWNRGIELATGDYVQILHHDDWFVGRDSLKKLVNAIESDSNREIVFSACNIVYSDGSIKKHLTSGRFLSLLRYEPEILFTGNRLGAPSICMFLNNGIFFDENLKWQVDSDFYISYLKSNINFAYIREPLVNIGVSDFQVTNSCFNNHRLLINEKFYLYQKHKLHTFSSGYRNSMLRTLARGKVFNNKQLKKFFPDIEIHLTVIESLKNYYYYLRHFLYRKFFLK